jgi:hypothetical protein
MKNFYSRVVLLAMFSGLLTFSAQGQTQTAPAKNIGPAAPNSKQSKVIDAALSAQTRHTLQDAMNSASVTDLTGPATAK